MSLIDAIHEFEAAQYAHACLAEGRAKHDQRLARFEGVDTGVPIDIRSASNRNLWLLEAATNRLIAAKSTLDNALNSFDSKDVDRRLAAEIAALEERALSLYNEFHRADLKADLARTKGWAIPADTQHTMRMNGPQIHEICVALAKLYPLRSDKYERVKYFIMLDALKERGQQKSNPADTTDLERAASETPKRRRSRKIRGKKYRTKNPPRPKSAQVKPDKKKAKGKGQKIKRGQKAA